jgi:hypothetical protein
MSNLAKILSLSYDSAFASKSAALKTYYRSVRLIKISGVLTPLTVTSSIYTNVLLCGNCIDYENRNLYVFYVDTNYGAAWIIEINIDSRVQNVVYYDRLNNIGFNPEHKIYNPQVVHGRLVWTDDNMPIYQMDIERAKRSFYYNIGYGQYPSTSEWSEIVTYGIDEIVSDGNNFYKSLIDANIGIEPKFDNGTSWRKLCLIEDAYYSLNIENFYFEAVPPKHPPVVTYLSDDSRKINNLRQTLFQFAYRYVYMDWRKSTLSPASIVPVPQAEEETATGLANEQASLNNKFKITVNTGGEEVRAIEVIGRSSDDPSKWYLIETINKFEEEERSLEVSKISMPGNIILGVAVLNPVGIGGGQVQLSLPAMTISLPIPSVSLTWVHVSVNLMTWLGSEYGPVFAISCTFDIPLGFAHVTAIPSWATGRDSFLHNLVVGSNVTDGDAITVYPSSVNSGLDRSGDIVVTDALGNTGIINLVHQGLVVLPSVLLSVIISDSWTITENTPLNTYVTVGSTQLHIAFKAHDLSIPSNVVLDVEVLKNGVHLMWTNVNGRNEFLVPSIITLPAVAAYGDVYSVILDEP